MLTIVNNKVANLTLKPIPCIHYLINFNKNQAEIQALIDSKNKINIMTLAYVLKLGLKI